MKENRILVIGSSNTDMTVKSEKIPTPGETVLGGVFSMGHGGKGANQAVAAARLGGKVSFICKVGNDLFGKNSVAQYEREGLDTSNLLVSDLPSGVALINVDASGENSITVAPGANMDLSADDIEKRPYLSVVIDNDYDPDHSFPISLTADKYSNSQRREGAYFVHEHVVLAHGLEYGKHTIRVYKKSECLMSKVAIKSLSCDGEFVTVEPKEMKMKMEFYGDSVTCGYAVESPDFYENFSTRTENSLMSYANYAANELSADVSLISCGGYPM